MRIIGHIEHPSLKVTIFKMDNKLSVKFENSLYEQTYKFRDGQEIDSVEAVQALVDDTLLEGVQQNFMAMHRINQEALGRRYNASEEEFERII